MDKVDRTAFRIQTFEDSDDDLAFWKSLSIDQVFDYAWSLTCRTYNISENSKIVFDKTVFQMRKNG